MIDLCIAERDQLSDYYDISFTGQWLLSEILTTKLSLQDLEAGLGGVNYFQSKFGGVTLSRLTGTNSNPAKVEDFSTIKMWDNLFSQAIAHVRFTISHEFAHIWDARSMLTQSIGLQRATSSNTQGFGCNTPAEVAIDSCTYKPKSRTASTYSDSNRREDWADSFAAAIYGGDWSKLTGHPHGIELSALTTAVDRINYVSGQIQQLRDGVDALDAAENYISYPSYIDPANP